MWLSAFVLLGCSKPKAPTLTPRSAQVSSVFASGVELSVEFSAHNPNGFSLQGSEVRSTLELRDGTPLGSATSSEPFSIPAGGDAPVRAKLRVGFDSLAALAPFALTGTPLPYRLRGSASMGGESLNVDVPFQIDGVLTAEQVVAAGLQGAAPRLPPP